MVSQGYSSIESEFETTSCLFGHSQTPEKLFERRDWWFEMSGIFAWYRCPICGLMFLNPRPRLQNIAYYYPMEYGPYSKAIDDERRTIMRWKRRRNIQKMIDGVNKRAKTGRLLDVGCSTGNYLHEMQRLGWEVQGVELQARAAEYARNRFGFPVFIGDLLESKLPSSYFDVVTMWDVLEHTHNPLAILNEVHRILKADGLLAFSIPDPESKEAKSFGPDWIGYDTPRHLFLFGGDSLHKLLDKTSFTLLDSQHILATYHTWLASWHTQLNRRMAPGIMRVILVKLAYLPLWSLLTSIYFHQLNKLGKGTILTVYAQPKSVL